MPGIRGVSRGDSSRARRRGCGRLGGRVCGGCGLEHSWAVSMGSGRPFWATGTAAPQGSPEENDADDAPSALLGGGGAGGGGGTADATGRSGLGWLEGHQGSPEVENDEEDAPSELLGPLLVKHVLGRLDSTDFALLARVAKPWLAVVLANNLPRAGKEGAVTLRVEGFVGSAALFAWAKDNGCPWNERTCAPPLRAGTWRCCSGRGRTTARGMSGMSLRGCGRAPGGAAVGAGEPLPVDRSDMCTRR